MDAEALASLADEMARAAGTDIVVAGGTASASASGPALELAAILLNVTLGAFDAGLLDESAAAEPFAGGAAALAALAEEMAAGQVEVLVVARANPVYDGFSQARFADVLAKVVVSLNAPRRTSAHADLLAPASHPFECWGDASLPAGRTAIQQPVIQPLFDTRGLLDVLVEWGAALGDPASAAAVTAAAAAAKVAPVPSAAAPAPSPSPAFHYLRAAWAARLALDPATPAFDAAWNEVLRTGSAFAAAASDPSAAAATARLATATKPEPAVARPVSAAALTLLAGAEIKTTPALELQLYPHLALGDGRSGNNGWLHELPDPITRITWGGALSIAPRRFDEMKLTNGDLVEIDAGHAKVVAPAYRHAGMHHGQVALPLGLGRAACGVIGAGVGRTPSRCGACLTAAWSRRDCRSRSARSAAARNALPRARTSTGAAAAGTAGPRCRPSKPTLARAPSSTGAVGPAEQFTRTPAGDGDRPQPVQWLRQCVLACQAENNVLAVGRRGMLDGREMSWIRIDRY